MHILNFAHPLTPEQLGQIEQLSGSSIENIQTLQMQIDQSNPLDKQIVQAIDSIGFSSEEWQTLPLLVNPPGLVSAALALIAELHGRIGYFPAIIRVRPIAGSIPLQFEIAEIINLQAIREQARMRRY